MTEKKKIRCVRWCQRCGGELCCSKERGVVCVDCFAKNEDGLYPIIEETQ